MLVRLGQLGKLGQVRSYKDDRKKTPKNKDDPINEANPKIKTTQK